MSRARLSGALALCLLIATASQAEVTIKGERKVDAGRLVRLDVGGVEVGAKTRVIWKVAGRNGAVADVERVGNRIVFTGPAGVYTVSLRVIDFKQELFEEADAEITIGEVVPPVPPTPPPGPGPGPKPDAAPIPVAGFRVLIVYESADATKLPPAQHSIIYGKTMRDFLNATCAVGPDNKTREWNIWDQDVDTSAVAKHWQDAMKRPRKSVPWLLVSNGVTGWEGPLPATVDETLALLRKYTPAARKGRK